MLRAARWMPHCACGCTQTHHIHASLGGRSAPTGVVHHKGTDRFFKLNSLHTNMPHHDGHDANDEELLYTFAAYDEEDQGPHETGPRLPLPRTLNFELFVDARDADAVLAQLDAQGVDCGPADRVVRCPMTRPGFAHGTACRYDDEVVVAKGRDADVRFYRLRVVGTAPAVGVVVGLPLCDWPELNVQQAEPVFVAEANLVAVCTGRHWRNKQDEHEQYVRAMEALSLASDEPVHTLRVVTCTGGAVEAR